MAVKQVMDSFFSSPAVADNSPHLIVEARAGTGKTTTLVEGIRYILGGTSTLTPSPQQQAVWDEMAKSAGKVRTIAFVAFNKSIATELQRRVPTGCDAMTMHSLGFKAVQKHMGRMEPVSWIVTDIIAQVMERDSRELRAKEKMLLSAVESLVSLCKMNLVGHIHSGVNSTLEYVVDREELEALANHYDLDLNGDRERVFELVPKVLARCAAPQGKINFDDMIWLPVIHSLPLFKYDVLLVDEAQDLNRCQQTLAKRAGKRLIFCGDPKQAIYGFAGADSQSMDRLYEELGAGVLEEAARGGGRPFGSAEAIVASRGCVKLPLTVTRRCGKAIVERANEIVSDFEAHESNGEGKVSRASYKEAKKDYYGNAAVSGDMVICRVNAPLVGQCFKFLRAGKKANIIGRDIGEGLVRLIEKQQCHTTEQLIEKLDDYFASEERKERAKRNPSELRLLSLQDRRDCIMCFCEGLDLVSQVVAKIEQIFVENEDCVGVRFSSIHKAKGLEADRVYFINMEDAPCPHPMAKTAWQREQEQNLLYVGITRAKNELVFVS